VQRTKLHIDLSMFDHADGGLPRGAEGRIARFAGRIVSFANLLPPGEVHGSGIPCRRRPRRRPCPGRLEVVRGDVQADDIQWVCPICRDSGNITGWKNTRWDLTGDLQSGQIVSLYQHQAHRSSRESTGRALNVYQLDVELIGGPIILDRPVARRIRIGGDQTLHDLHELLRSAFDWRDDEPYDFMFGAPYEPDARRFTGGIDPGNECQGEMPETRAISLDSLELCQGQTFGYLFDFGEEWIHRVTVSTIVEGRGYVRARVVERQGTAPPQHPDPEDLWQEDMVWAEADDDYPMTGLYGPYIADEAPEPEMWLAMDELEQQLLVTEAHSSELPQKHPTPANTPLHALIHCLAETEIARGDSGAQHEVRSLVKRGLSRHEAIHNLGARLATASLSQVTRSPSTCSRANPQGQETPQPPDPQNRCLRAY
jgi:hypothetical protein